MLGCNNNRSLTPKLSGASDISIVDWARLGDEKKGGKDIMVYLRRGDQGRRRMWKLNERMGEKYFTLVSEKWIVISRYFKLALPHSFFNLKTYDRA